MALEQEMFQRPIKALDSPYDPPLHKKVENDKER